MNLHEAAFDVLMATDVAEKCALGQKVASAWKAGELSCGLARPVQRIVQPGRPAAPELVPSQQVPKRSMASLEGRLALMHAVAHIEFNAINLAWDAVYRFRDMPEAFYSDWISVALDEARHFQLLQSYLQDRGASYGDFDAHNGLWEMALKTDTDVLVRMALVPRVLEARGLDVTPGMIAKLETAGDTAAVENLTSILNEEVRHVLIGSRWFHYCCEQRQLDSKSVFYFLVEQYMGGLPRGALNIEARLLAGFEEDEILYLQQIQPS